MADAAQAFAAEAVASTYETLPASAVEAARRGILDTLGVAVAATGLASDDVQPVRGFISDCGSTPQCTRLVDGGHVSMYDAAFWFGTLAHALDYDDVADEAVAHPSAATVAAALSVAERLGNVSGKELLTAVALGQDIVVRLGLALNTRPTDHGWLPSVQNVFGATIAVARLLRLDVERTVDALGIALNQVGGSAQCIEDTDSSFRAIRDGFSARGGVVSAILAERGLRGDSGVFEGRFGYFNLFFDGNYDHDRLLKDVGEHFAGDLVGFKAWPSCTYSQYFLTALSYIVEKHDIRAQDVETIIAVGNSELIKDQCTPTENRVSPSNAIQAKFSLPFQLGKVVANGTLRLSDFTASGLSDAEAVAIARRVEWSIDPRLVPEMKFGPGRIKIRTFDGQEFARVSERSHGHRTDPLSWRELVDKFADCVTHSSTRLPKDTAEVIAQAVESLEEWDDVGVLVRLLSERSNEAGHRD